MDSRKKLQVYLQSIYRRKLSRRQVERGGFNYSDGFSFRPADFGFESEETVKDACEGGSPPASLSNFCRLRLPVIVSSTVPLGAVVRRAQSWLLNDASFCFFKKNTLTRFLSPQACPF